MRVNTMTSVAHLMVVPPDATTIRVIATLRLNLELLVVSFKCG